VFWTIWPARIPAANIARAAREGSISCDSGSKIGPGDIISRFQPPKGPGIRPPNGSRAF
jgi:hypothetical protein